ncbi:hypothetical protein BS47DRAFT_1391776 [Hydnum rufescens UP504]|uniref:Pericentrin/AKAP-450 centrosomal targeting domain-containing protein n=1 Tax=Hydnum rufescens UP504 TaxID=1448309 RepID=A0A9P6B0G1_9AGAM|nr:hypothetical protein BS47DRAFT_1391776 [Hydnum rufescens UP504]
MLLPYETPSRVMRRIEDAEREEMPSLPPLPSFEMSTDENNDSTKSSIPPFNEADTKETYFPGPSQSTPPQSLSSRSLRPISTVSSSRERFAASIVTSRSSSVKQPRLLDDSFGVSQIEPTPLSFNDLSAEVLDDDAQSKDAAAFVPAHVSFHDLSDDQALSITDALESVSLSSDRDVRESEHESINVPVGRRNSMFVSKRRPMPRLRDDFFKSPVSLSNSSLNSSRKSSLPPKSPQEPQELTETIVHAGAMEATPMPKPRPTVTFKERPEISSYSLSPPSHSPGSDEEDNAENDDDGIQFHRIRGHSPPSGSPSSPSLNRQGSPDPEIQGDKEPLAQASSSKPQDHTPQSRRNQPSSLHSSLNSQDITEIHGALPTTQPPPATPTPQIPAYYPAATPADRHKSFLLSLVHSTARPRFPAPTPHPQTRLRRPSHPLAQVYTPASAERDSFISTASSHDLTANVRVNASFDPTTDVGAKFNQLKLNTYLHGLNKHLIEENKNLTMLLEQQRAEGPSNESSTAPGMMAELMQALQEELAQTKAERDLLQQEATDADVEFEELRKGSMERSEQIRVLQREVEAGQTEAKRRTELHAVKVKQLSDGAEAIINEVQVKLDHAEAQVESLKARLTREGGHEAERVKDAEDRVDAMRGAKAQVEQELAKLQYELSEAKSQNHTLKDVVTQLEDRIDTLDAALHEEQSRVKTVHAESIARTSEERRLRTSLESHLADAKIAVEEQVQRTSALEGDLTSAESRARNAEVQLREMEEALEESEKKIRDDEEELRVFGKKVEYLTKERDLAQAEVEQARRSGARRMRKASNDSAHGSDFSSGSSTASERPQPVPFEEHERIVSDLEAQLEDAEREIGRLEHIAKGSPASKAINAARSLRIETLEKDNKELEEKVTALRDALQSLGSNDGTPIRGGKISWLQNSSTHGSIEVGPYIARIQELHGELDLAGENLDHMVGELGDAGLSVVKLTEKLQAARGKIGNLEKEIDGFRRSEDRIRKRLERCKCQKCGRRFDASALVILAGNPSRLSSFSESVDISVEDPAQSREALQSSLEKVNDELLNLKAKWANEKQVLAGEKAVLRDTANRLNAEIKAESAKVELERKKALEMARRLQDDAERQKALLQLELDRAGTTISSLETDLRQERAKLRSLVTEQTRISREKGEIKSKLGRTETDMEDIKNELERLKQENRKMEDELRTNSQAEQEAKRLAAKVAENQAIIEQLRRQRETLTSDHAELQRRYSKVTEQTESVRKQLAQSQAAHDDRRHQLDLRVTEIEDLRLALQEQAAQLQDAESEKNRLANERIAVARTISALESDLKRVRRDAEKIGRNVSQLKAERAKMVARSQEDKIISDRSQAQIRELHVQLVALQTRARKAEEDATNHVCDMGQDALAQLQLSHNKECKGLMLQIRYLKFRFTRESAFRADLGYQKQYLLKIVSVLDKSEKSILAAIAQIGFPQPAPIRQQRSLRAVALTIIFTRRSKIAFETWRVHTSSKEAIASALEDVRRRRALAGS